MRRPRFAAERHRHRSLGGPSAALAAMGRPRDEEPSVCPSPAVRLSAAAAGGRQANRRVEFSLVCRAGPGATFRGLGRVTLPRKLVE